MKKVKVTFWIMGFGCGIVLAGMIGTLVSLKTVGRIQEIQEENKITSQIEQQVTDQEFKNEDNKYKEQSSTLNEINNNSQMENINNNEAIANNKEESVGNTENESIETNNDKMYQEVFIPSTSGSGDICRILEAAGVIEDGDAFHEYIKAKNKQKYLKDGTFSFPKDADYETLLKMLLA